MSEKTRRHADDLRGASRLAVEATRSVTALVQAMHHNIAAGPRVLGRPLARTAGLLTGLVYGSIRGITWLVGSGLDAALEQLAPLLGESAPGRDREAVLAVLNGVLGDYLEETGNPLAIQMELRHGGHPLRLDRAALAEAFPRATGKLLLLVHGSSLNDLQWSREGHDHGQALARDLGFTPVYLRYNSGLHISTNGRALSDLLERLAAQWPEPLGEIAIVAHSMGGLLARSACHAAESSGQKWRQKLRTLVCLGSPHHGAALERGGSWVDLLLGISRYSAPLQRLGQIRSKGVTDLRFGNVLGAHWEGVDRFAHGSDRRTPLPLPAGVRCFAIAASTAPQEGGKLPGDGLVSVDSALGRHADAALLLRFTEEWIAFGARHLDLLGKPEVYDRISAFLAKSAQA